MTYSKDLGFLKILNFFSAPIAEFSKNSRYFYRIQREILGGKFDAHRQEKSKKNIFLFFSFGNSLTNYSIAPATGDHVAVEAVCRRFLDWIFMKNRDFWNFISAFWGVP